MCVFIEVFTADTHLARVDFSNLPQQSLMEMLVEGFLTKTHLEDNDGFKAVEEWKGVRLNPEKNIRQIDWRDRYGSPSPSGGTVALQWLPSTMQIFALTGSKMEGTVDIAGLPQCMKKLYLQRNSMSGTVDLAALNPNFETLILHTNQFCGCADLRRVPKAMQFILLHGNCLRGTVIVGSLPNRIEISLQENAIDAILDEAGEIANYPRL